MNRNLERRVIKLEDSRRDLGPGAFFVWSRDEDGQPEAIRSAIESGQVQVDDPIILGVWTSSDPMPAPHWADGVRELSDVELQILRDIVADAEPGQVPKDPQAHYGMCRYTDGELLACMASGYSDTVQDVVARWSRHQRH